MALKQRLKAAIKKTYYAAELVMNLQAKTMIIYKPRHYASDENQLHLRIHMFV